MNYSCEKAWSYGNFFITIQNCDEGFDYTIYKNDKSEYDGGVLDNLEININDALKEIILMFPELPKNDLKEIDYDEFMEE